MTAGTGAGPAGGSRDAGREERSDWRVVLQFFVVPLSLVAVLVTVFFGLQVLRSRRPDARATLDELKSPRGVLLPWAGDPKRWQSGYDLSLLLRSGEGRSAPVAEMAEAFEEARSGADLKLRRYLALALGRAGDERADAALVRGLEDPDGDTRLYCAWGLMQVGGGAALAALRRAALGDADEGVRTMAVFALGERADTEARPILRKALDDKARDVRWNAALSLARLRDAAGEPVLIEMVGTAQGIESGGGASTPAGDDSAVLNAIRGLALLGDDRARAALERAARSAASEEIRATARLALDSMGAQARESSP